MDAKPYRCLCVGLGNPGSRYEDTRHNIGHRIIGRWADKIGLSLSEGRFKSKFAQTLFHQKKLFLLCPLTYMNLSGDSVRTCADYYDLEAEDVLVVHDDLDLPLGRIKATKGGGAGGHKGVLSIRQNLKSENFARIKIGIGRPRYDEPVERYVLTSFYADEREISERVVSLAIEACEIFVMEGIESVMNNFNSTNLSVKEVDT